MSVLTTPAPLHAFEVRIAIGGNDRDYVVRALKEILEGFEEGLGNSASGGWDGSHSVTVVHRDITPDAYRAKLEAWRKDPYAA